MSLRNLLGEDLIWLPWLVLLYCPVFLVQCLKEKKETNCKWNLFHNLNSSIISGYVYLNQDGFKLRSVTEKFFQPLGFDNVIGSLLERLTAHPVECFYLLRSSTILGNRDQTAIAGRSDLDVLASILVNHDLH